MRFITLSSPPHNSQRRLTQPRKRAFQRGEKLIAGIIERIAPQHPQCQPPNPVPCLLLGQLATDTAWAGQGIGTGLLRHALVRCVAGARLIGGRALVVNALDQEAADFWRRRGFLPSKDDPLILFRSMAEIAASLTAAGIAPD